MSDGALNWHFCKKLTNKSLCLFRTLIYVNNFTLLWYLACLGQMWVLIETNNSISKICTFYIQIRYNSSLQTCTTETKEVKLCDPNKVHHRLTIVILNCETVCYLNLLCLRSLTYLFRFSICLDVVAFAWCLSLREFITSGRRVMPFARQWTNHNRMEAEW